MEGKTQKLKKNDTCCDQALKLNTRKKAKNPQADHWENSKE